jgi:DNA polymerase
VTIAIHLDGPADFAGWRGHARKLASLEFAPEEVRWLVGGEGGDLFESPAPAALPDLAGRRLSVPRGFIDLGEQVICHRDPDRYDLLYRLLLRLQDEPRLLRIATDGQVHRAEAMARSVRRDLHKMTAFVRFREIADAEGRPVFVAWFEPEHHILDRVSGFFVGRFAAMRWSILTPEGSLHWDGETLMRGPGAAKSDAPREDRLEPYWRSYYANIFNPARLKVKAMKAEMPVKYWRNLPEAELIAPLIAASGRRTEEMVVKAPTPPPERHLRRPASEPLPSGDETAFASWEEARKAARNCSRCDLCQHATQTVFGEGPLDAPVLFVGEQPGDQEDLAGRPFVGPAGRMFDHALDRAGLIRERAYVTNAVKHFKFQLRGKRRIHQKPNAGEIAACRFWLGIERDFLKPDLVVALGATALHALTGHRGALGEARGRDLTTPDGTQLVATVHPSYLLRLPDEDAKAREIERFIADLRRIGERVPAMRRGRGTGQD